MMDFENNLQFYHDILEHYEGSILIIDTNGTFLACSKGSCKLLNMNKEEVIGQNAYEFLKKGILSKSTLIECLESKKPATDFLLINNDPNRGIYAYARPIFDKNGELTRVITFSQGESFSSVYTAQMKEASRRMKESIHAISNYNSSPSYIAENPQTKNTFEFAKLISQTDTTVIINGESGTGKEVLAQFIHSQSNRRNEVFIPVNCAAIPDNLIESELFGYEKGSFTGADKNGKTGLFELANHGTLFLDEIGELPLHLQSTLLRVLETSSIRRIGGKEEIKLDVRIVAATNRNLLDMVHAGTFREDLYYRLNILPLTLQPLRQRPEDIKPLTDYFLKRYNHKFKKNITISTKYLDALQQYPWPGNVRELKNVIQRYVITDGNTLYNSIQVLPPQKSQENFLNIHTSPSPIMFKAETTYKEFKQYYETEYFTEMLRETNGNINKISRITGLHISGIYKKLQKLNLKLKDFQKQTEL